MSQSIWSLSAAMAALVVAGCSDPVPPAPRGNFVFTLSVCDTYSGAIGGELGADAATRHTQLPATDGTNPGRRIEDGQDGASISCTVDGGDTHRIVANLSGTQTHPSAAIVENVGLFIEDGWIQKTETGGTGEANITLLTGQTRYFTPEGQVCTLSLDSARSNNQFTVDTGRVYARFSCPELSQPPSSNCGASGAFVLERCKED